MEILGTKKKRCKANNDVQDHQWEGSYSSTTFVHLLGTELCLCRPLRSGKTIPKEGRLIPPTRLSRNMHDKSFQIPSAASDYRKYSFFPRTIRDWNALPPGVATANPRHLGTWTFRYWLGLLGTEHFGTDLDISVLGNGQFETWMRQYSVLTTNVWYLLICQYFYTSSSLIYDPKVDRYVFLIIPV